MEDGELSGSCVAGELSHKNLWKRLRNTMTNTKNMEQIASLQPILVVAQQVNAHTSKDSWVYQLMDTNDGMLKFDNGGHTTNNHNLGARPFG